MSGLGLSDTSENISLSTTKYINKLFNRTRPDLFSSSPAMDMIEDEYRVHISLDMPGFDIKDITLTLSLIHI